ncbi:hypothetical protein BCR42DRAFT_407994 [Absidia repens]|uniref:Uncharacterized protein n=1 Tax=Absidia repens TaxID=90262 RepID=A0A1X2IT14_9FUNG|nr:hypothetical protein BCR42DRAFT_407994 [Absidia repens]
MNDSTTPSSLSDSYATSENALMDSFKAAALKVTTLYRDSLVQNRKAYASGYQQALQDLYEFISSHPKTMVSQQGAIVPPTEHGSIPVQDLLSYARRRNDQLTSQINGSSDDQSTTTSSPAVSGSQEIQQQIASSTNIPSFDITAPSQQQQQQDSNNHVHTPVTHRNGIPTVDTAYNKTDTMMTPADGIGDTVKNAFYPFQIDPNTQFTFSLPLDQQSWHSNNNTDYNRHLNHHHYSDHQPDNNSNNSNYQQYEHVIDMNDDNDMNNRHRPHDRGNTLSEFTMDESPMEGLKRRLTQQELTCIGRALNNMNIDSAWNEPAFKRRFKKDG